METTIESPFADGFAKLKFESDTVADFRGEQYRYTYAHYVCEETGESFVTDEVTNYNLEQVYSRYRKRYGVPTPKQIADVRALYGLTKARMSQILGFGPNQYHLYEDGMVPSLSSANLISLITEPKNFLFLLDRKEAMFRPREFSVLRARVVSLTVQSN